MPTSASSQRRTAAVPDEPLPGDDVLLRRLRDGDEATFARLVDAWSPIMLRMALVHVRSRAVAEEVVQEAWLTMLGALSRYERRSSLRTWVLGIVINLARARARAERRCFPFTDAPPGDDEGVPRPDRFRPADAAEWPDHWAVGPTPWPTPEQELLAGETRTVLLGAVAGLPAAQREVLVLRDLAGWSAHETCDVLRMSEGNQRVLLHRARSRVRSAVEDYFGAMEPT